MHGRGTSRRTRLALGACLIAAVAVGGAHAVAAQSPAQLLPDLRPQIPTRLSLRVVHNGSTPHVQLRFRSAIANAGAGPLLLAGVRARGSGAMRADQVVALTDGGSAVRRGVGRLRYIRSRGHWNATRLVSSELRAAGSFRLVRRAGRTGACLRDVGNADARTRDPGEPAQAVFTGRCGRRLPGLRHLRQGLSVGYVDVAGSNVAGQDVDITTLRSGRYWLVQRVDPGRDLVQSQHANDAASLLMQITWRSTGQGRRTVTVSPLRACPSSARCTVGVSPGAVASGAGR